MTRSSTSGAADHPHATEDRIAALLAEPSLSSLLDDKLVVGALATLQRHAPEAVRIHSLRTFVLASRYAERRGLSCDQAGLLAAAAFHDLGLCPALRDRHTSFPRRSARLLEEFLADHDVAASRGERLVEAVARHMAIRAPQRRAPEVALLHAAAWLDVTGRGSAAVRRERARLHRLAPTPGFAVTLSARVVACSRHPAAARALAADLWRDR